jgi:uncharacterized protein YqfA (UPF0365 family)
VISPEDITRWPRVVSPDLMPSISKRTTSGSSVSGPKVQRIECKGRTQITSEPEPQRIDFGQGNERTIAGISSAITSCVARPFFSVTAI